MSAGVKATKTGTAELLPNVSDTGLEKKLVYALIAVGTVFLSVITYVLLSKNKPTKV